MITGDKILQMQEDMAKAKLLLDEVKEAMEEKHNYDSDLYHKISRFLDIHRIKHCPEQENIK